MFHLRISLRSMKTVHNTVLCLICNKILSVFSKMGGFLFSLYLLLVCTNITKFTLPPHQRVLINLLQIKTARQTHMNIVTSQTI